MRLIEHSASALDKATRAINQAVRLAPDDPEVMLQRGFYFAQISADYPRAVAEIERVAQLQPGAASWRWALWVVHSRQGRWLDALNALKVALRLEPNNYDFSQLFFASVRYTPCGGCQSVVRPERTGRRRCAAFEYSEADQ
jgi:tetratricopeptide (TPR) repeat protein